MKSNSVLIAVINNTKQGTRFASNLYDRAKSALLLINFVRKAHYLSKSLKCNARSWESTELWLPNLYIDLVHLVISPENAECSNSTENKNKYQKSFMQNDDKRGF